MGRTTRFILLSSFLGLVLVPALRAQPAIAATTRFEGAFDQRMAALTAVEEVYRLHRLDGQSMEVRSRLANSAIPRDALQAQLVDQLRRERALDVYWGRPLTHAQVQAELDRMVRDTRSPERLREIFAALGNDPTSIAETIARPLLAERELRAWFDGDDRFHDRSANFDDWWAVVRTNIPFDMPRVDEPYAMPPMSADACVDAWQVPPAGPPEGRYSHTAIWTGSEMIVFGSFQELVSPGGRYDPATDTWRPINTAGAASLRYEHTAVWTGSEMIVWGGFGTESPFPYLGDGGRYNPQTDTWRAVSQTNAPSRRAEHAAVWTGSQMLIWGGQYSTATSTQLFNDGSRYDPATDTWTAMTLAGAPTGRIHPLSAFLDSKWMIVWGGEDEAGLVNNGRRYNTTNDTWATMSSINGPGPRQNATMVGTAPGELIVWGGTNSTAPLPLNSGARYRVGSDSWTPIRKNTAPSGRIHHSAVWSGSEMIVWGGDGNINTGGRYNPVSDSWTATTTSGAPEGRTQHTAVWTGSEMIVWGGGGPGALKSGGRYSPASNSWVAMQGSTEPSPRTWHTAVWTGSEMIVWGGGAWSGASTSYGLQSGGRYDPALASWRPTKLSGAPIGRRFHTAVWSGAQMLVWGGGDANGVALASGSRYDPVTDAWQTMSSASAPSARHFHTAVWTGSEMIVWGGQTNSAGLTDGGRYSPATDAWTPLPSAGAPGVRNRHTAVWTGSQMLIWGGAPAGGFGYSPTLDLWTPMGRSGEPDPNRYQDSVIWNGHEMLVWGGIDLSGVPSPERNTGGRYDPVTDTWRATTVSGAPAARAKHTAVWNARGEMIVWGGAMVDAGGNEQQFGDGASYNPSTDSWEVIATSGAPTARSLHTAIWSGSQMLVWGGEQAAWGAFASTGGAYCGCGSSGNVYPDVDQDGYGDAARPAVSCARTTPTGWVTIGGDCRDDIAVVHPGAPDTNCDGTDQDCNGLLDDQFSPHVTACGVGACASSGTATCVFGALADSCVSGVPTVELCDSVDNDCDATIDNATVPDGLLTVNAATFVAGTHVTWSIEARATGYDVVRGALQRLISSGGDFGVATERCLANDLTATSLDDADRPAPGAGFWYLARPANCGGGGSYESAGASQIGTRDPEIGTAVNHCP